MATMPGPKARAAAAPKRHGPAKVIIISSAASSTGRRKVAATRSSRSLRRRMVEEDEDEDESEDSAESELVGEGSGDSDSDNSDDSSEVDGESMRSSDSDSHAVDDDSVDDASSAESDSEASTSSQTGESSRRSRKSARLVAKHERVARLDDSQGAHRTRLGPRTRLRVEEGKGGSSSSTMLGSENDRARRRRSSADSAPVITTSSEGLGVGADVMCEWSGNKEEYPAKILKTRSGIDDPSVTEFYVRYSGFDHRLDEWVPRSRIREMPSTTHGTTKAAPRPSPSPSLDSGDEDETHLAKNVHSIELGRYEIETWYYSPYPDEYCREGKLFLCEFCLKYMKKRLTLERHAEKCEWRHPPGVEIYRDGELSVYEVDGKKQRVYCQNLCLLSKLFLDHKTLYYDVDPFYFYVLTECDEQGAHIVGYFSKEKSSAEGYNLACIMTLPPYQRNGYGSFLISLSYELSKREGVSGSPEKPLSDLGRLGYRSYWSRIVLSLLRERKDLSVRDIAKLTGIAPDDVVDTLRDLNMIRFSKGKHVLVLSERLIDAYLNSTAGKRFRLVDSKKLSWAPKKSNGRAGESRRN